VPAVSVLLPYRDSAATLAEAAGSILAQRGVDLELIAIDDGSRDDGPALIAARAARDPRVVAIATGGVGIARALTAGLAVARGPLVARMDGDDISAPDRLRAQLALLAGDASLGMVATEVEGFPADAVGDGMRRYIAWQNGLRSAADHARELYVESPVCHPSVVIRRDVLDAVGAWRDFDGPEDYDLWLRIASAGWGIAKVPSVLLQWRHRAGRSTFADPRYAQPRFVATKAPHLARALLATGKPIAVWGAGATGKRMARALEPHGVRAALFIDIDPRKHDRTARGAAVAAPDALAGQLHTVVVAVGARGARDSIRPRLEVLGYEEGVSYWFAA
jgi:glycosyltransferase involved in cell wall biosynthesis